MDDILFYLPIILVVVLAYAFGGGFIAWLIAIGICVAILALLILCLNIDEKWKQRHVIHIKDTYPLAYTKFDSEHGLRYNGGHKLEHWSSEQRKSFFYLNENDWATMQRAEEERIALKERVDKQYDEIQEQDSVGLEVWLKKNNFHVRGKSISFKLDVPFARDKEIKLIEKEDVVSAKDRILAYQAAYHRIQAFKIWEGEQRSFSEDFHEVIKLLVPRNITVKRVINYTIPGVEDEDGRTEIAVYHSYFRPFCLDESLDYSMFPHIKSNTRQIQDGVVEETDPHSSTSDIYDYYCYLIKDLLEHYTTILSDNLFCYSNSDEGDSEVPEEQKVSILISDDADTVKLDPCLFSGIRESIITRFADGRHCSVYMLDDVLAHKTPNLKKKVIIIGNVTYLSEIEAHCKRLLSLCPDRIPLLYYISINAEISSDQMRRIIERKKESLAIQEEKQRQERILLDSIPTKVQNWESLRGGLKIKYLIDYYPTTVEFEADDEEWDNRWLVWHFKNDPEKTTEKAHRNSLDKVIPQFVKLLTNTFGREALGYLTFVCIPASTQEKNELRYKTFSAELCQETGIENGYEFTHVSRDRTAQHEGGERKDVNYSFDDSFFRGKRVILFDDIITTGDSMRMAKAMLEKTGATVICGLAIGKTRHERRDSDE